MGHDSFPILSDDNQVIIRENGGIDMLIQAMKAFPRNAAIQENACAALWNLAVNGKENQEMVFFFSSSCCCFFFFFFFFFF
jgi:hypothetical protein